MDLEHLQNRVKSETSIDELLGDDYQITIVAKDEKTKRPRRVSIQGPISRKEYQKKLTDMLENRKDDIGVIRLEYIVENDQKGEWVSKQVREELNSLPYILRERKHNKDVTDGEETVYVAEYAVSTDWIEE